ncbi:lipid-binding SYLF domain-containing protein [Thiomicrorhabdus sp.]|uniref:lipid-binding SYLF domain-containing protein n=1 Tax=Thiomicrorhabdus sp. TaxID=2039724 RepID=UPI0029C88403|nr:lipid-binding SYLF domain-containing protein [Thiomicrorhabdus sp.]
MKQSTRIASILCLALACTAPTLQAAEVENAPQMEQSNHDKDYAKTIAAFRNAAKSTAFFKHSYGYAVFPTIGKVGFVIGGAYGQGRVYKQGQYAGMTEMTQGSIGFQLGGQAFSQIIFFQDKRAYDEFTSGNFEFGAQASAVVVTAGVAAEASTKGTSATANAGNDYVAAEGQYYKGMAVFTIAKGGLMYEAAISGQKFNFYPK